VADPLSKKPSPKQGSTVLSVEDTSSLKSPPTENENATKIPEGTMADPSSLKPSPKVGTVADPSSLKSTPKEGTVADPSSLKPPPK
jgi:hypothetical protein